MYLKLSVETNRSDLGLILLHVTLLRRVICSLGPHDILKAVWNNPTIYPYLNKSRLNYAGSKLGPRLPPFSYNINKLISTCPCHAQQLKASGHHLAWVSVQLGYFKGLGHIPRWARLHFLKRNENQSRVRKVKRPMRANLATLPLIWDHRLLTMLRADDFQHTYISLGMGYHQVSSHLEPSHSNVTNMTIVGGSRKESSWPHARCFKCVNMLSILYLFHEIKIVPLQVMFHTQFSIFMIDMIITIRNTHCIQSNYDTIQHEGNHNMGSIHRLLHIVCNQIYMTSSYVTCGRPHHSES